MTDELYPVLPLRDVVVFPGMVVPLFVGRESSVRAVQSVVETNGRILLLTQKEAENNVPEAKDLYDVGTLARVVQLLRLPDATVKLLVEGQHTMRVEALHERDGFFEARCVPCGRRTRVTIRTQVFCKTLIEYFESYAKLNPNILQEAVSAIRDLKDPFRLAHTVAQHLQFKLADKQSLLETFSINKKLERLCSLLDSEINVMHVEKRIRGRVQKQMEKTQRDYYLNEKIKAIQKELGGKDKTETETLKERLKEARLPSEAAAKAELEIKKLSTMSPLSSEASVVRGYLDWLLDIPWHKKKEGLCSDIEVAHKILNEDHYALDEVKDRILEYIAVQMRVKKMRSPILCLVGAPGVGKTSLGRSIARATGRDFVRVALGGVRDEAEIRGHRRTYIGAMPGKIIQGIKRAGSSNPLFLLDEIDKLGADWRGDPSSALLEVLDPEQNSAFNDHYLEVDYDLSDVMFVTTANTLSLPAALRDRMEVIRIPGYTEYEKVEIAERHLVQKQRENNGLKASEWSITSGALTKLIRSYTREAGVRNLEREVAKVARKVVKRLSVEKKEHLKVTEKTIESFCGVPKYRYGLREGEDLVGVVTGLAWTEFGGEILLIESVMAPGKGRVIKTGTLGDVMQESIKAAESYIKSRAASFGIKPTLFAQTDFHLHVPEGATPKDGPSAGVAMATSLVSVLTGIPVKRDVAMTGEITLRGRILPIGGLREKLVAALRSGIKTVLIPEGNKKDLAEVPERVKKALNIVPVETVETVLDQALVSKLTPLEWNPDVASFVPTENTVRKH